MKWNPFNFKFDQQISNYRNSYYPNFEQGYNNCWAVLWGGLYDDYYSFAYSRFEFTERLGVVDYLSLGLNLTLIALGKAIKQTKVPIISQVGSLILLAAIAVRLFLASALQLISLPLLSLTHLIILPLAQAQDYYEKIDWDPFSDPINESAMPISFIKRVLTTLEIFHGSAVQERYYHHNKVRIGLFDYLTGGVFFILPNILLGFLPHPNYYRPPLVEFAIWVFAIPLLIIPSSILVAIRAIASLALTISVSPLVALTHLAKSLSGELKQEKPEPEPQSNHSQQNSNQYSSSPPKPDPYSSYSKQQSNPQSDYEARARERELEMEKQRERESEEQQLRAKTKKAIEIADEGKDLFASLGISKEKYKEEPHISKKAYRKLVLIFHPDKVKERAIQKGTEYNEKDATDKWNTILEANEILGDKDQAKAYIGNYRPNNFFKHAPPPPEPVAKQEEVKKRRTFKDILKRRH